MSEQEQIDEELVTDAEDTTTDALDTDVTEYADALTDEDAQEGQEQKYGGSVQGESKISLKSASKGKRKKKKKTWMEKCMDKKWTCDNMPSWRVFMNT